MIARTLVALLSLGSVPPPPSGPVVRTAAVMDTSSAARNSIDMLVNFVPGPVICGVETVTADRVVNPFDTTTKRYLSLPGVDPATIRMRTPAPRVFDFTIDATGRPAAIRARPVPPGDYPGGYFDSSDLPPALAAWRFRPGTPRTACTVTFAPRITPIDQAPTADLARLLSGPIAGPARAAAFDRLKPPGSTCYKGPPANPRTLNFPPFEEFARTSSDWTYASLSHDIDAAGRPVAVRQIGSSGNAAFDAAARAALIRNRYQPGVRTGCLIEYHARSAPLPEPPRPATPVATKGPECAVDLQQVMTLPPGRPFPPAFARRGIAGHATVRFDVAAWGQTGNIAVVASEPAEAFGITARSMIQQAKFVPSPHGYRGCVSTIRFLLPGQTGAEDSNGWRFGSD